jgi:hypothetical protein
MLDCITHGRVNRFVALWQPLNRFPAQLSTISLIDITLICVRTYTRYGSNTTMLYNVARIVMFGY